MTNASPCRESFTDAVMDVKNNVGLLWHAIYSLQRPMELKPEAECCHTANSAQAASAHNRNAAPEHHKRMRSRSRQQIGYQPPHRQVAECDIAPASYSEQPTSPTSCQTPDSVPLLRLDGQTCGHTAVHSKTACGPNSSSCPPEDTVSTKLTGALPMMLLVKGTRLHSMSSH